MKRITLVFASLATLFGAHAQGVLSQLNWSLPNGGQLTGGVNYGFNATAGGAFPSHNTGSQTWAVMDMNGDAKPDLVVAAQLQGGQVTCFSPGLNQYWQVYLNTGTQFNTTPLQWSLPNGGRISNAIIYGFDNIAGTAFNNNNTGSQSWLLSDMNGDKLPDLVVTAQLQGGNVTCFSPGSGQYWKVYTNTGTGFATTATNWDLPNGGKIAGGTTYGYNSAASIATPGDNTGSQSWSLTDMDGDSRPDLVVTAQLQGGNVTCFSPGSGQYWKVFSNTGSGFSSSSSNWNLPNGGRLSGGTTYGYDAMAGNASPFDNTGSQSWAVMDMNADKRPDLIVAAQLQGGNVTCFSPGSGQYWKVYTNDGSSFSGTAQNWNLPNGGKLSGGVTYGFNAIAGTASPGDNTGSQSWTLFDTDGYGEPELVITAQLQGGNVTCFSPGNNQYWNVYGNVGHSGFASTPVAYQLPNGGRLSGGVTYGYNAIGGVAATNDNTGSQSWVSMDMNGDNKPDLVVAGQLQAGYVTSFSPLSDQYWKVYTSDFVAGISEANLQTASLLVFPNPGNNLVQIRGTQADQIKVSNQLGQTVQTINLTSENQFSAQITNLPKGVYILSGNMTRAQKIIID